MNRVRMRKRSLTVLFILLLPGLFFACSNEADRGGQGTYKPLPEYTKEEPGRWAAISKDHAPTVELYFDGTRDVIRVKVALRDSSHGHFIEKIGIFEKKSKKDLYVIELPSDVAVYDVTIPYPEGYKDDQIKVFAKCNLHDLWTVDEIGRFRK